MKKLNDVSVRRFYAMCEDIKNSLTSEELNFNVGVACGFASGLFLTDTVNIDCYKAMRECIDSASVQSKLGGAY
jgi:hypothetical protein